MARRATTTLVVLDSVRQGSPRRVWYFPQGVCASAIMTAIRRSRQGRRVSPSSEGVKNAEEHGFGLEVLVEGERVVGATTA